MNRSVARRNRRGSLDPRLWHKIPPELLERILSFIPLKNFLPLRRTCKSFRSLIFSPLFLSKHANSLSSSPLGSFLLLSHPQSDKYLLYDTVINSWRDVNLPLPDYLYSSTLLCTANCLLCFSVSPDISDSDSDADSDSDSAFAIFNLLSGCTNIIDFPEHPFAFELPTLITNPSGYHLFCLGTGSSSSQLYAYVYDSKTRLWTRYDGFEPTLGDTFERALGDYLHKGVFLNGSLYFTTRAPFAVVSFDLQTGKWDTSDVEMPEELTFIRLVTGNGDGNGDGEQRLFLFGGYGLDGIEISNMKVWVLDVKGRKWKEVESIPDIMCTKLGSICYHLYEHISCFWHCGMICVSCFTWPEVLCYKVSTKTWHWTPISPSLPEEWSCGFEWFSFVPEFYALV